MTDLTIAKTILSQFGGNKFIAMTGAKSFVGSENSLTFKIGRNSSKCNYVKVIYNYGKDLYEVEFLYVSTKGSKVLKKFEEVSAEDLQERFSEVTGMYTYL